MFRTKSIPSLNPLNACKHDIESEKIIKLFSLLRRITALFGNLLVLVVVLYTTAAHTCSWEARIKRPCSNGAQGMPKAVYHSGKQNQSTYITS